MDKLISDFVDFLTKKEFGRESIEAYKKNLAQFESFLEEVNKEFLTVTRDEIINFINKLKDDGFRNNSINQKISTLRLFYSFISSSENIKNPADKILNLKNEPIDRECSVDDIKRLINYLEHDESLDLTSRMVAMLIIYLGIKGSTVTTLTLSDLFIESDSIIILIKKKKIELSKIKPPLALIAKEYLNYRLGLKVDNKSLFLNNNLKPISRANIVYLVKRIADKLKLQNRSLILLVRSQNLLKDGPIINSRYTILKEIRKSGLVELYKVRDNEDRFKLKLLSLFTLDKEKVFEFERLKIELNCLKSIMNKNIVRIFGTDAIKIENTKKILQVHEYFEFSFLSDYVGRIKPDEFIKIAYGLLNGLSYLSKAGNYQIQIDTENIIVVKDKIEITPKFLNWGVKLPIKSEIQEEYVAPETLSTKMVDEKAKIYSIGVLLYYLATNRYPECKNEKREQNRKQIKEIRSDLPDLLIETIMDMIEFDPDIRLKSTEDCLNRLKPQEPHSVRSDEIEITSLNINIHNELSLIKMKIDKLLDEACNGFADILLIEGEYMSGKSFILSEVETMARISGIPIYKIDTERDPTAMNLASIFMKKDRIEQDEKSIESEQKKISLFESATQMVGEGTSIFAIDNIDKAKDEFCEFLLYIIKRFKGHQNNILFAMTYEGSGIKDEFIKSLTSLIGDPESILKIVIMPYSKLETSNLLASNFALDFSQEALDYIFANSCGLRGKLINIVDYFLKNKYLYLDSKKNQIDLTASFYNASKKAEQSGESPAEGLILALISALSDSVSSVLLKSILNELNMSESEQNNSIETLEKKGIIKRGDDGELVLINRYIATLHYNTMESKERKNIHNTVGSVLEKMIRLSTEHDRLGAGVACTGVACTGVACTGSACAEIATHFLKAENIEKLYYYFMLLAENAGELGLLNDSLSCYDKIMPFIEQLDTSRAFELLFLQTKLLIDINKLDLADSQLDKFDKYTFLESHNLKFAYLKSRIALKRGNIKNGLEIIESALKQILDERIDTLYLEILILKNSSLISLARFSEIINEKEESRRISAREEFKPYRIRLMNLIALAYCYSGNLKEAENILKDSLSQIDESKNSRLRLRVLNILGMVLHQSSQFSSATKYYEEALKIASNLNDLIYKATLLHNLGGTNQIMGNFKIALTLFDESGTIYSELGEIGGYENLLFSRAFIFANLGLFDRANVLLKMAEEIATKRDKHIIIGYIWALKGDIAKTDEKYDEAIDYYDKALSIFEKHSLLRELCLIHLAKTETYLEIGKNEEAYFSINEAQAIKSVTFYPDIEPRITLSLISLNLLKSAVKYAEVHEYFCAIEKNIAIYNNWELKLKFFKLKALYDRLLGNYDESLLTIKELRSAMENFVTGFPADMITSFLSKSEFGRFLSNFENKYVKKSMVERILEINLEISQNLNLDILLSRILTNIILISESKSGAIILKESDNITLVKSAIDENCRIIKKDITDFPMDIIRDVIANNKEVLLPPKRAIVIPLLVRDIAIGVLYIEDRENRNILDRIDIKLLTLFASQSAIAIDNARIHKLLREQNISLASKKNEVEATLDKKSFYLSLHERRLRDTYGEIVGRSNGIINILNTIDRISESDISVLIEGESGTGKELIARAIHQNSKRKNSPFIGENCAAFSENLLESELFGYQKGAFTGAYENRKGIFEMADSGTVFLDEIGDMSLNMQKKLLRLLESGELRRVGDETTRKVDIRIVSATNKDVKKMVESGNFREDLYYRINGVTLTLPPLRERKEDIPQLVRYFLDKHNNKGSEKFIIDDDAIALFLNYNWPGNIRELKNEIERLIVMSEGGRISVEELKNDPRFYTKFSNLA